MDIRRTAALIAAALVALTASPTASAVPAASTEAAPGPGGGRFTIAQVRDDDGPEALLTALDGPDGKVVLDAEGAPGGQVWRVACFPDATCSFSVPGGVRHLNVLGRPEAGSEVATTWSPLSWRVTPVDNGTVLIALRNNQGVGPAASPLDVHPTPVVLDTAGLWRLKRAGS
ncbi:hypothetical protein KCV87_28410 [Actinosynnema pretiosum subsp. pretiosum]|uniref:Secreted protein n=2 Tax=Actinosynnema TaxID=40566 RepID=C6WA40_ACTMD|nr:hypothetical protein [Actinosynnema mirum]ACU39229.1 hypothetical protein Amir_5410 [Actinosynnema mirum DSM 43827]AXX32830.1 hypothetical protein APASM_5465 [Actinosynnema pretiosum subsp. pretiosum]QUF03298.1 hypothetical protein KCV87_28410 [Actinosynnema pretiosum subsp. pretiosum]